MYLEKNSKGTLIMEIEYLKQDVERLISLLKTSKEFKDFTSYIDSDKGIRFLAKSPSLIAKNV